jgi:hypothetical protein
MGTSALRARGLLAAAAALAPLAFLVAPSLADAPTDAHLKVKSFTTEFLETQTKTVSCPDGERVVGGGLLQTGSPDLVIMRSSGPLNAAGDVESTRDGTIPTQWTAGSNNQPASHKEANEKVMAICSAHADVKIEASLVTIPPPPFGDRNVVETQAECPGTRRATGGGVVPIGPTQDEFIASSGPLDENGTTLGTTDGDVPTQWDGAAISYSTEVRQFKVFAICSKDSRATVQATTIQLPGYGTEGDFAECPDGQVAVGGGFVESGAADGPILEATGPLDQTGSVRETQSGDRPVSWYAAAYEDADPNRIGKVFAVCEPR